MYTQEVTTIEHGPDNHDNNSPNHHHHPQQLSSQRQGSQHNSHHSHHHRSSRSLHDVVTCHRQTQTELIPQLFPEEGESKQKPEVEDEHAKSKAGDDNEEKVFERNERMGEEKEEKLFSRSPNSKSLERNGESEETENLISTKTNRVDASTSPIPSPYFTDPSAPSFSMDTATANPFTGCSQMSVYPPLNYVRKLEDLEKITGHIVIQRFFTKTDDAFGSWLEKQLGMTTKSVSVDTSEFENAKTVELLQDETVTEDTGIETGNGGGDTTTENGGRDVLTENGGGGEGLMENGGEIVTEKGGASGDIVTENGNASAEIEDTVVIEAAVAEVNGKMDTEQNEDEKNEKVENNEKMDAEQNEDQKSETVEKSEEMKEEQNNEKIESNEKVDAGQNEDQKNEKVENNEKMDAGQNEDQKSEAVESNEKVGEEQFVAQEGFITGAISNPGDGDLQETENRRSADVNLPVADCAIADSVKCECYLEEMKSQDGSDVVKELEAQIVPVEKADILENVEASEIKVADEVETLLASTAAVSVSEETEQEAPEVKEEENNKVATEKAEQQQGKNEEDIDEVVRCTLEAYLMTPMNFDDNILNENEEVQKQNKKNELESLDSPLSGVTTKSSEVDSGRADSIQSQVDSRSFDGMVDTEGNTTSHDSVETVYEIPLLPQVAKHIDLESGPPRILQRCLSADSCIGTESSGDAKNPATNASQSSNDTIEVLDPIIAPKELSDFPIPTKASRGSAPFERSHSLFETTKLPAIPSAKSVKLVKNYRSLSSARSQRSLSPGGGGTGGGGGGRGVSSRKTDKTDVDAEDADGESETESEITDNNFLSSGRPMKNQYHHHHDGTDLELEEVDEDEGDDDDRDAFDKMVANHLKYSRGLPTATSRRSRLNRGTQTTKSIEPSTTSGSISPCSASSNSSFDVEIISKSKRITTTGSASTGGGLDNDHHHHEVITPSNMTLAWHEGGRRRSYLPTSSSSLNLLNMKFSLGKDFESEVSIRMPTTNKSSMLTNSGNSQQNLGSASMLLPGSGGGGKTLLSNRTHHHHHNHYRGLSSSSLHSQQQHNNHHTSFNQSPGTSAGTTATTLQMMSEPVTGPGLGSTTELQSLWKDVRTKLDVQVDEISSNVIPEEESHSAGGGLHVRGSGILPVDPSPHPGSGSSVVKIRRNEEKIKRSLQRLKKILDE